ncbi:MAG: hypothetical protein ABIT10_13610 [Alteraurantiacibacter sp.]
MASSTTASLSISEMREFAGFTAGEQEFITRSLDVYMARGDAFKAWGRTSGGTATIRAQYLAYRELHALHGDLPATVTLDGLAQFIGPSVRIAAQDLVQDQIDSFSAFRFLYERMLGAAARPFLPAIFCAAAALPQMRPCRRKMLLQSLSEAAATAPGWSDREPAFFPERLEDEAA